MKTAFLQTTPHSAVFTPVRKAGRQNIFGAPVSFELPETLRGPGKAFSQPHALAVFAAECMRGTPLSGSGLIVCLDSGTAVTKEYRHLPAKEADLRRFAALEAETVLKDSPDNYFIATREYGRADLATGRLKSILFAVPKTLVASLVQEFRSAGLRVLKICPMLGGLAASCRVSLGLVPKNNVWKDKTVAVVDAGYENLRVILFADGAPVFEKEFDSVWPDILETLHGGAGCSYEEALREMKSPGFLFPGGNASFGEPVMSLVNTLLETAFAELMRNMRVVLSAERLELQHVFFCGALASHPDFDRYVDGLSLDIPFGSVETASKRYQTGTGLEKQAGAEGSRRGDFFTLNGMLAPRGTVDFLKQERARRGTRRADAAGIALLCLAAAAVMAVEPAVYRSALAQQKADANALSSPQVTELKGLETEKDRLEDQLQAVKNDKKLLPYRKSKMEEAVGKLQAQLAPKVASLRSCQFSGSTGTVAVSFTATDLHQFNGALKNVSDGGYFEVLTPFTVAKNGASGYQCSVTLKIIDFRPASAGGGAAAPAASGPASSAGGG